MGVSGVPLGDAGVPFRADSQPKLPGTLEEQRRDW